MEVLLTIRKHLPLKYARQHCTQPVKGCNVAESLPIYDEIHLPGFSLASAKPSLIREFFVCFSLKGNLRSIGKTKTPLGGHMQDVNNNRGVQLEGGMSDIKVIHGLRTLSMIWIIFGHTIGLVSPEMMSKFLSKLSGHLQGASPCSLIKLSTMFYSVRQSHKASA